MAADPAVRRLDADDAVRRRREPDAAAGVGADGAVREPRADRHAGTGGRHAGPHRRIPDVARRVDLGMVIGKRAFREFHFADDHRARFFQARHRGRVFVRHPVRQHFRAARGLHAARPQQVLQRDRHAVQRAERLAFRARRIEPFRARHGGVGGDRDERAVTVVGGRDPVQRVFGDGLRRQLAALDPTADLRQRQPVQVRHAAPSRSKILPGLRMRFGSNVSFKARISATSTGDRQIDR